MKRRILIILGAALLLVAAFCGLKLWRISRPPDAVVTEELSPILPTLAPTPAQTVFPSENTNEPEPSEAPYISPIDFDTLRSVNPDIYGWIRIDNTNVDYPVVQRRSDDEFYLTHNSDGEEAPQGAIFSEGEYNGRDFTDPVTILYGHNMKSGAMFGQMQKSYSDSAFFEEDNHILVFTPDEELEYGVFAVVPYGNEHILYYHDFSNERVFTAFFDSVFGIRDLRARFNSEYSPVPGDRVLILSTCLSGNLVSQRFLVMAKLLT